MMATHLLHEHFESGPYPTEQDSFGVTNRTGQQANGLATTSIRLRCGEKEEDSWAGIRLVDLHSHRHD